MTNGTCDSNIGRLSDERVVVGRWQQKKYRKKDKKVLDMRNGFCYHIKVRYADEPVPCKLNNVRQTKTPWTIKMDCLSV